MIAALLLFLRFMLLASALTIGVGVGLVAFALWYGRFPALRKMHRRAAARCRASDVTVTFRAPDDATAARALIEYSREWR